MRLRVPVAIAVCALSIPLPVVAAVANPPDTSTGRQVVRPFGVRPVPGRIVRPFAPSRNPYGPGHRGVLLDAGRAPVRSAGDGTVVFAGQVARTCYVTVRQNDDSDYSNDSDGIVVRYGGLRDIRVRPGQTVLAGQILAAGVDPTRQYLHLSVVVDDHYVDPAGLLPGAHLHLER